MKSTSRSAGRGIKSEGLFQLERLEQRQMLAAAVRAIIPTLYTNTAPQTPLADTTTLLQFTPGPLPAATYYRIATDDAAQDAVTSIYIAPNTTGPSADAAIALFD